MAPYQLICYSEEGQGGLARNGGGGAYLNSLIIESQPDRSQLGSHRKDRELVDLCLETLKRVRLVEDSPE